MDIRKEGTSKRRHEQESGGAVVLRYGVAMVLFERKVRAKVQMRWVAWCGCLLDCRCITMENLWIHWAIQCRLQNVA